MIRRSARYSRKPAAPVAQLDRALASEAKGCGFDPRRAHVLVQRFVHLQNICVLFCQARGANGHPIFRGEMQILSLDILDTQNASNIL